MAGSVIERQEKRRRGLHLPWSNKARATVHSSTDHLAGCLIDLSTSKTTEESYLSILRHSIADVQASGGYFLTQGVDLNQLFTEMSYSPQGSFPFPEVIHVEGSLSGQVLSTQEPILVRASKNDTVGENEFGSATKAALCVPIRAIGTPCLGVLTLISTKSSEAFKAQQIERIQAFASILAMVLVNEKTEKFRRNTIVQTLESMSAYLEAKDPLTAGHSLRVARIATAIGHRLDVSKDVLEHLRIGSILMDLGNVAVPDSIMKKPGSLSPEEFAVVKSHSVISYEICQKLQLPEDVLVLVRNHHERLDGTGYPDQLRSAEIPLALRILCVADAYDAMRCARPHREGMSEITAVRQLTLEAGTKFDPVVVQCLKDLVDTGEFSTLHGAKAA